MLQGGEHQYILKAIVVPRTAKKDTYVLDTKYQYTAEYVEVLKYHEQLRQRHIPNRKETCQWWAAVQLRLPTKRDSKFGRAEVGTRIFCGDPSSNVSM